MLVHFVGIGGTGMSALAQFRAMDGGRVSGSDRSFDQRGVCDAPPWAVRFRIRIAPQDGSAVPGADLVVTSTAVEDSIPDVRAAKALGIPLIHRSELLAAVIRSRRTIAVTGSSGKSTVVAMIFEALRGAGLDPGVLTGGDLSCLADPHLKGNAWVGRDWLVVEADESDKSLVRYEPEVAVILNVHRDHYEKDEVLRVFREFRNRVRGAVILGSDDDLEPLRSTGTVTFGLHPEADHRIEAIEAQGSGTAFRFSGAPVFVSAPGAHNALNAAAALAVCATVGADLSRAAAALARFRGVSRRFELVARNRGVEVVDDFAHNPAKVAAALRTARERSSRVLALFQPHGFAPMKFMRHDLARAFADGQRPGDRLFLPEILYVGGTAVRDISSRDLCSDVVALGGRATFLEKRADFLPAVRELAAPGDCVLVMGARDPSLGAFAREVGAELERRFDELQPARAHGVDVGG